MSSGIDDSTCVCGHTRKIHFNPPLSDNKREGNNIRPCSHLTYQTERVPQIITIQC